jgi:tetratricopeptide (TPR) repeat protein
LTGLLEKARRLAAAGQDAEAKEAYLAVLRHDPTQFDALNELGALAYASGHRSAARTACEQAVKFHPDNPVGRVNLGNLLFEEEDFAGARAQYEAALAVDADCAGAHQGLARAFEALGETEAAAPHWKQGFAGRPLAQRPYRGSGTAVPVLLLVSARGGNIPVQQILDDRIFAVTALYAEFYDPAAALSPHAVLFNAIGDADFCGEALARADEIVARSQEPIVNLPLFVRETGRAENARRMAAIPSVIAPVIQRLSRAALSRADDLEFPLLLRAPGFHTGKHFRRIEDREALAEALAALPGEELLAVQYLDARGADGMARKYRVMAIDGALYPLHLAVSADWKVHYFSAAMADNEAYRAEEKRFLEDMPGALGERAMAALGAIAGTMTLDYAGIDFALAPNGEVLFFEANATMVINPPDPDPVWDYRRAPIARALEAAKRMVMERAGV